MDSFNPLEKKIIAAALAFSAMSLALVGYASFALGIQVPDCVTDREPFTHGEVLAQAPDRYEVHLVAKMWAFEPAVIRVPAGATVDFYVSSPDVTHGLHIEGTNVNLMAVPGVVNRAQAVFRKPGKYAFACHEYCGIGHQDMYAHVEVVDGPVTDAAPAAKDEPGAPDAATVEKWKGTPGFALLASKGCVACHSIDGSKMVGPTLFRVMGRSEAFEDGGQVTVDEAYLRESIREPAKHVVKGFAPVMPPMPLSDDELETLVSFLKELH